MADDNKKSSQNSDAAKPKITISIDRNLQASLEKDLNYTTNRSAYVERAIRQYMVSTHAADYASEMSVNAAKHLLVLQHSLPEAITRFADDTTDLRRNIAYLSNVVERIFGMPVGPYKPDTDPSDFAEERQKAMAVYASDPSITANEHKLDEATQAIRFAAYTVQAENHRRQVLEATADMPFLTDGRFVFSESISDFGLYDTHFPAPEGVFYGYASKHFRVARIEFSDFGQINLYHAAKRPYFKQVASPDDGDIAQGIAEIVKFLPVMVADYLAYRRFEKTEGPPLA